MSFVNVQEVNTHSLLIRVEGQRPTKNPFLLCGHMDVVPIASGQWARHPFSGDIYRYLKLVTKIKIKDKGYKI